MEVSARSIGSILVFMLSLGIGLNAHAAALDPIATINVTKNGPTVSQGGTIDQFGSVADLADDWALNILPAGSNTGLIAVNTSTSTGTVTGMEIYEVTGVNTGNVIASSVGNTINAALDGTKSYVLRIMGIDNATSYIVDINAVPIPAAAVLFLSALLGYGFLGRGRKAASA